jgi:hypothetical protein
MEKVKNIGTFKRCIDRDVKGERIYYTVPIVENDFLFELKIILNEDLDIIGGKVHPIKKIE